VRIYLDTCCISRLFDEPGQARIRDEAAAIEQILDRVRAGEITWVCSIPVRDELVRTRDLKRRADALAVVTAATLDAPGSAAVDDRASELTTIGFANLDAYHLASAEAAGCQVLITVDDRLLRCAARNRLALQVEVKNPVDWMRENPA
jgi:predicted nucleic acid-binding protein